jgi:hypothetical protein
MPGFPAFDFLFPTSSMNVLALTILISSCLAGIFIACFAAEIRRSRRSSPERDSLLPLDLDPSTPSKTIAKNSI